MTVHNTPYLPYSFQVSVDIPVPVADPLSLGLPPDAGMGSKIRLSTARGGQDTPLARVFAPRSGQPGVRKAPSLFWILDGPSDGRLCSVRPVDRDIHEVYAADGTLLATVTRRAGRVVPWPRRVRWSARLTTSPQSVTGKVGTWYSWGVYVVTSPIWFLYMVFSVLLSHWEGAADDPSFGSPARTCWRVRGNGTALDYRGIGQKTYHFDPRRLDLRVAYALAVLRTWEAKDQVMAHLSKRKDKAHGEVGREPAS
ncbi:hypothetical protein OG889_17160 [Streptomyces sp. NBC_00481]|uniref:hypothetical protein n=1 Tax=unclassified Streptomyces TaxID=2593676 RepID=UPI002DDAAEA9|nr:MULTISPECIES: hypothetical protein [unclassified Streptomyces]WRY96316.1 hypothetical protein OG889_17160 [Streptomyces sp. NBC_00481]